MSTYVLVRTCYIIPRILFVNNVNTDLGSIKIFSPPQPPSCFVCLDVLKVKEHTSSSMASEEHKALAGFIKEVHSSLRQLSTKLGPERAWAEHCKNKEILETYARNMELLATTHWQKNSDINSTTSRIDWIVEFCHNYFINDQCREYRAKEENIALKLNLELDLLLPVENFNDPIKLLDVGSCYNPFKSYDFFDVTAIDLSPANQSVFDCDFLQVTLGDTLQRDNNKVTQLPQEYYDAVTFCFLLEYIPSSDQRLKACENAYSLLKPGGLLLINTPDSKHVGANARIMKCWRYTLALLGFSRIKYEKFKHMHCMAFRKAILKDIAIRWASIHKQDYMDGSLPIPQDSNNELPTENDSSDSQTKVETKILPGDFVELPFCVLDND